MKPSTLLAALACAGTLGAAAQSLPTFTRAGDTVWYNLRFATSALMLHDPGAGRRLVIERKDGSDAQKWAIVGSPSICRLVSRRGHYAGWDGQRLSSDAERGTIFTLVKARGTTPGWELQRRGTRGVSLTPWGGSQPGYELGEWTEGEGNATFDFAPTTPQLPAFAAGAYYFVQFCRGGLCLQDAGAGRAAVTASVADPVPAQMWRLVGTRDSFTLHNEAGRALRLQGTGTTARFIAATPAQATAFKLVETRNVAYSPGWELRPLRGAASTTALTGPAANEPLTLGTAGAEACVVRFVQPQAMSYDDYKVTGAAAYKPDNKLTLWYTRPATLTGVSDVWMEYSLPIGNGQLGASLFGGVHKDRVQFNEKTLWTGTRHDNGAAYGNYQNFGSFYAENLGQGFGFASTQAVTDYVRTLNMPQGYGTVSFVGPDGVRYERTYLVSHPDSVVAVRYAAGAPGRVSLRFTLEGGRDEAITYSAGEAAFGGKLETVSYNARLRVVPRGGSLTTDSTGITVRGADEVVVYLAAGTDFDALSPTFVNHTNEVAERMARTVRGAEAKGWTQILRDHQADYCPLFARATLDLDGTANDLPTDSLVMRYSAGATAAQKNQLEQMYFAYGRYLEIGSSRGVALPANLQGIWNDRNNPAWSADIHSNINVQMNYWPAEPTNLSEIHLPFLQHIMNMAMNHDEWPGYARASGQTKGWTVYTAYNIFGGVCNFMQNYVIANAWYVSHLWQHYRYTLDRDFLRQAFPTMWSCAEYWMQRMTRAEDGTYECPNEYSPEHGPSQNATAHAQQLVVELFDNTLSAARVLGSDADLAAGDLDRLRDYLERSDRGLAYERYTGAWGSTLHGVATGDTLLREWKYSPYTVGENGHRHNSHLMCLYPFAQVRPGTPEFRAAVNSLKLRSDVSTGWSMGWRMNLWARALDGDHAHRILTNALRHTTSYGINQYAGGIYYNLYDGCAPFQIDGNFGATAGMAEMLLQSVTDTLRLLPALPTAWPAGRVEGLKAVGNFTVSMQWRGGRLAAATIVSHKGQALHLRYPGVAGATLIVNGGKAKATTTGSDLLSLPTAVGDVVTLNFDNEPVGVGRRSRQSRVKLNTHRRTITATGEGVERLTVYDLEGRTVSDSARTTITVPASAGSIVLVKVTAAGSSQTHKVKL